MISLYLEVNGSAGGPDCYRERYGRTGDCRDRSSIRRTYSQRNHTSIRSGRRGSQAPVAPSCDGPSGVPHVARTLVRIQSRRSRKRPSEKDGLFCDLTNMSTRRSLNVPNGSGRRGLRPSSGRSLAADRSGERWFESEENSYPAAFDRTEQTPVNRQK